MKGKAWERMGEDGRGAEAVLQLGALSLINLKECDFELED